MLPLTIGQFGSSRFGILEEFDFRIQQFVRLIVFDGIQHLINTIFHFISNQFTVIIFLLFFLFVFFLIFTRNVRFACFDCRLNCRRRGFRSFYGSSIRCRYGRFFFACSLALLAADFFLALDLGYITLLWKTMSILLSEEMVLLTR